MIYEATKNCELEVTIYYKGNLDILWMQITYTINWACRPFIKTLKSDPLNFASPHMSHDVCITVTLASQLYFLVNKEQVATIKLDKKWCRVALFSGPIVLCI